jgi:hypothetical protein
MPDVPTNANVVLPLLHTPPVNTSDRVMEDPAQTPDTPVMVPALRNVPIVTTAVTVFVPQVLVTV